MADTIVEKYQALYRRAVGYETVEVKSETVNGSRKIIETTKHYPRDTTACIFWLKNRQPQHWRNRNFDPQAAVDGLGELLEAIGNSSRGLPNRQIIEHKASRKS